MTYKMRELIGSVVKTLRREFEYLKPNFNPGPYIAVGTNREIEEIKGYGGKIEKHNGHEMIGTYEQSGIVFDAIFKKAPGGNPFWTIAECGKTVNGNPRESVDGFELKGVKQPKAINLDDLVK